MPDFDGISSKANRLASRMNQLTEKLGLSDELLIEADDIVECVAAKTQEIKLFAGPPEKSGASYADIMNLEIMVEDFQYVRETLREVTDNARRVQGAVTIDLLDTDDDKRAALVVSFAELSKAITDAQKLYVESYRHMSTTLLNLNKIKAEKSQEDYGNVNITNNNLFTGSNMSTVELIQKLKKGEK